MPEIHVPTAPTQGTSEVVRFSTSGGTPTTGGVVVGYKHDRTALIPFNATATQFRDALRLLNEIGAAGVTASGGPWPGTPIDVSGAGNLSLADLAPFSIVSSTLNAGATASISVQTAGVTATFRGQPAGSELIADDTGDHWVNIGTASAPVWRRLATTAGLTVADLVHAFGTADGTLDDVGGAFNQATLNNNFKELSAKLNAVLQALRSGGKV